MIGKVILKNSRKMLLRDHFSFNLGGGFKYERM
jgi:hypothetical protein